MQIARSSRAVLYALVLLIALALALLLTDGALLGR